MGFAWDFLWEISVLESKLLLSGDEGVDDLPSAFSRICPTESFQCTDHEVLIEVRIFNEDQMVCNVEGASFYELRIAGNFRNPGEVAFGAFDAFFQA